MARCVPGDLAVIVSADFSCNLGRFVRVLRPDRMDGEIVFRPEEEGPVWWVSSAERLTWKSNGRLFIRMEGPVPDRKLQPIRGELSIHEILEQLDDDAGVLL